MIENIIRKCVVCDIAFVPKSGRQNTCSDICQNERAKNMSRIRQKRAREKNPDATRAKQKRWLEKVKNDPEKIEKYRLRKRRWQHAHKDKIREINTKRWLAMSPDERRAHGLKYAGKSFSKIRNDPDLYEKYKERKAENIANLRLMKVLEIGQNLKDKL